MQSFKSKSQISFELDHPPYKFRETHSLIHPSGFMDEFKSKLHLFKLPNRISSPSSCIPVTACLIICEVSLFVSAVKYRKAIMLITYASLASQ